jgi:hypothetical protein
MQWLADKRCMFSHNQTGIQKVSECALHNSKKFRFQEKQETRCTHNVTLRHIHKTTVAMEKEYVLHTCVCVCVQAYAHGGGGHGHVLVRM